MEEFDVELKLTKWQRTLYIMKTPCAANEHMNTEDTRPMLVLLSVEKPDDKIT